MKKVMMFSVLLVLGLVGSQVLPGLLGAAWGSFVPYLELLTMTALAFIMIHVGYEFEIDKKNLGQYGWDYLVAMTAAAFPWIFATLYFVLVMMPQEYWGEAAAWKESLLAGRFAAPTSAGILFSMLAAAGLSATWVFVKARILAIFDDLDTVLLMIPLKMMMVGLAWQLGAIIVLMAGFLWAAWRWLHSVRLPLTWPWVMAYAVAIAGVSEAVYVASKKVNDEVPIHVEVLLPAFVLGCMLRRPEGSDPHLDDTREGHQEGPENPSEQLVSTVVAGAFMVLVGLSMPSITMGTEQAPDAAARLTAGMPAPGWGVIALHVVAMTAVCNLGKMFPLFCYGKEAHWRERLAVCIGMWPRGEVGAGVLVLSLSYGIGGPVVTVAMLSLTLNLLLTGAFIAISKRLLSGAPPRTRLDAGARI